MVKHHILTLLSQRDYTVSELARLLKISEPSLVQYLIYLQKDKQPIVIEKGLISIDKGNNPWAYVSGALVLALTATIFLLGNW
jgi:hypothetical protein